jgi:dephospho-CoA kinase
MRVFGLTGGIGMGKSTAGELLRARSVAVVDTDDLAREVVEPGEPGLEEVRAVFGPGIVGADGRLRRDELARVVFVDPSARRRLEGILHPRIREQWRARVEQWRAQELPAAVIIIPLLFETQAEKELDATICVACRPDTQRRRLLARGWSGDQIDQRLSAQMAIEQKMHRADYLVWTEVSPELCGEQLDRVLGRS